MEQLELAARINLTQRQWNDLAPYTVEAYDALLEEDDFWDAAPGLIWSRPIFWQEMGNA
tara:strand:- start:90 stop:266 length:177 start_codon:yes stop_codon:yes gene_type:complete